MKVAKKGAVAFFRDAWVLIIVGILTIVTFIVAVKPMLVHT